MVFSHSMLLSFSAYLHSRAIRPNGLLDSVVGLVIYYNEDGHDFREHDFSCYSYDENDRLIEINYYPYADRYLYSKEIYHYNDLGQVDSMTVLCDGSAFGGTKRDSLIFCWGYSFTFDSLGRKISKSPVNPWHTRNSKEVYYYDKHDRIYEKLQHHGYARSGCVIDSSQKNYSHTYFYYYENELYQYLYKRSFSTSKGEEPIMAPYYFLIKYEYE